ncbi:MAG: hypothetical protein ACI9YH_001765 [Colwellia sp.]|jgi:hypothetical protein
MHLKTYSTTRTIKETVDIATGIIIKTKVLNDKTPVKTILEGLGVIFDSNGNSRYYSKVLRYIKKGGLLHEAIYQAMIERLEENTKLALYKECK